MNPAATLRGHDSVSSLCFIGGADSNHRTDRSNREDHFVDDDDDDCLPLLASCDTSGNAYIWKITTRRIISQFGFPYDSRNGANELRTGPGLNLRRLSSFTSDDNPKFLYQTRGNEGIVSIHDCNASSSSTANTTYSLGRFGNARAHFTAWSSASEANHRHIPPPLVEIRTLSRTFCEADPCRGDGNLVVTPAADECMAKIYDIRMNPRVPIISMHGAAGSLSGRTALGGESRDHRKHGMITSLCMAIPEGSNGRPIVACGMESGNVFFHDCGMIGTTMNARDEIKGAATATTATTTKDKKTFGKVDDDNMSRRSSCTVMLGKDPVLCLDIASSSSRHSNKHSSASIVAIAGCAGDAVEQCDIPIKDRGTVALMKASLSPSSSSSSSRAKVKYRMETCRVGEHAAGGKPGVSCCKFRSDGKMFAVGGWDRRARIFSRKSGKFIDMRRGHSDSVTAVDFAPDVSSGLFATGSGDGLISLWNDVFPGDGS